MQEDATRGRADIEAPGSETWSESRRTKSGAAFAAVPRPTGNNDNCGVRVQLTAVVVGLKHEQPVVLVERAGASGGAGLLGRTVARADRLPAGLYQPVQELGFEGSLRASVQQTLGVELGFVDQLTATCGRADEDTGAVDPAQMSISYLALTRIDAQKPAAGTEWVGVYDYLPWEDFRKGRPQVLVDLIVPGLERWCAAGEGDPSETLTRAERLKIAFATDGGSWDDERVVDRLELIREAGLDYVSLAVRRLPFDDLRTLAAGLARLRAKIRLRPVVFELLPPEFTLYELQKTVEAILGPNLHKQNFRRLVEGTRLVEPTGQMRTHTGGRPAQLFRFRHGVLLERPAPGVRVRIGYAS